MKICIRSIIMGAALSLAISFHALAMSPEDLKAAYSAEYTAGKGSVYGPALDQGQLNEVAQVVADFVNQHIQADMTDEQKIREMNTYLFQNVSYAESWSKNSANTAYGALVNHTAQCSGYARAFKALCDAVGIECYYVHAEANAFSPEHQWNIVKYDGRYYHMDVQENCLGNGGDSTYLSSTHVCSYETSAYPQIASEDAPVTRYHNGEGPYAEALQNIVVHEFPGPDKIWMEIISDAAGPEGVVDYGVCQAIKLPADVRSIMIDPDSPFDQRNYNLQMAIIPYYGQQSRENGALCLALENNTLTNFQALRKGKEVCLDPLGLDRLAGDIAQYCQTNDIFFELVIFDENAYRKLEQEQGYVTIDNLVRDIPGMVTWLTY